MTPNELLDILAVGARLKENTRHCWIAPDRKESVADHSWRLGLFAMLLADEPAFAGVDMNKVTQMCLIHDLGEAFTGDIPAFEKTNAQAGTEDDLLFAWVGRFPEPQRSRWLVLLEEMQALETPEAQVYKALDKADIGYAKTKVGDKYVYENMVETGNRLGGEQSGHIIFSKYATTGDGILTSMKMMEVMLAKDKPLSELPGKIVSANAYMGVEGILKALEMGGIDLEAVSEEQAENEEAEEPEETEQESEKETEESKEEVKDEVKENSIEKAADDTEIREETSNNKEEKKEEKDVEENEEKAEEENGNILTFDGNGYSVTVTYEQAADLAKLLGLIVK